MQMNSVMDLWKGLSSRFAHWSGWPPALTASLLETIVTLLLLLVLRWAALHLVRRRITDVSKHYHWRRGINYATGLLLLFTAGSIWFDGLRNLGTFLGLVSAGVAVALGDLLANFAGWAFIMARRPYVVGDRIELDGLMGDVTDIRLFTTTLLECGGWVDADQPTGRLLQFPNGQVFKKAVANYTVGFQYIWNEIPVMVTFESNWRKAKGLLKKIAQEQGASVVQDARKQIRSAETTGLIRLDNLEPSVWTDVKDSGVVLTIRYLTHTRQRRATKEQLWEAILDAFNDASDIDLAYPTRREFINYVEGKPGTIPASAVARANQAVHHGERLPGEGDAG